MRTVPSPPAQRNTRWPGAMAADRSLSSTAQALTSRWPSAMKRPRSQTPGSSRRIHAPWASGAAAAWASAGSASAASAAVSGPGETSTTADGPTGLTMSPRSSSRSKVWRRRVWSVRRCACVVSPASLAHQAMTPAFDGETAVHPLTEEGRPGPAAQERQGLVRELVGFALAEVMQLDLLRTRAAGFRESRPKDVGDAHDSSSSTRSSMSLRDARQQRSEGGRQAVLDLVGGEGSYVGDSVGG